MIHYSICDFCDSICGLEIEHDGSDIISIRGDGRDAFSRGHICPKGIARQDLHHDPDRLRHPVRRRGNDWEEVSWTAALREAGERLADIQKKHGRDAVGVFYGNPVSHNYAGLLCLLPFVKGFRTRHVFSAVSLDALARMLVSLHMYGNQAVLPIPDIDRAKHLLIIGANPVISNGSIMTAPDCRNRLIEFRQRGGKIVVIDPRRTETAKIADDHHFIRPGTDALLLLAMINTLFQKKLIPGRVRHVDPGALDAIGRISKPFSPESVSRHTGIKPDTIRSLAGDFAASSPSACYGRMGTSTQEFGTLATWLIDVLNIITGNFDAPGGMMLTTPAVDLARMAKVFRQPGTFNRWQSRVSGLPEFNGEFPVAAMAEEMDTPGPGRIRGFVTLTGNPVLSVPNGRGLDKVLAGLDFMVSIDCYINETTRHADLILPPASCMEIDHYGILEQAMGIRNAARYAPALFEKPEGARELWEIMIDLRGHLDKSHGGFRALAGSLTHRGFRFLHPGRQLDLLLRFGPHHLSLKKLSGHPHGIDLGPLEPRLEQVIMTSDRKINLVPELFVTDLERLNRKRDTAVSGEDGGFLLITRRTLRSINTWMHNSPHLVKGRHRCTLMMNPDDARGQGLASGQIVRVTSRVGGIRIPLEVTDEMMPGVVSMPFGWGHDREGVRLAVASRHPGVSMNDVTDEKLFDRVSGMSVLDGIPVNISKEEK